ncbi:hypothetical protein ACFOLF_21400 [Paenibacillus sepulcri]|uniref:hypothetical protein n=1 Tax=Paenibacillus sepulcri TaxID=359917 RepID=UPI001AE7DC1C
MIWTAPGDDGTTGTAASYDIRVSTAPITDANFASTIPVKEHSPACSSGNQPIADRSASR